MIHYALSCLLFGAHIVMSRTSQDLCPPREELEPCGCTPLFDGGIRLDCIQVPSAESSRRSLSRLKYNKEVHVDYLTSQLGHVHSDLFSDLPIQKLSFINCDIESIGDIGRPAFIGLDSTLKSLEVSFSFKGENYLEFLNLSNLNALETLQIEGNNLEAISDEWFKDGPRSLRRIYVMTNDIKTLGDNVFSNLESVVYLWLNGNKISSLKRSMLPTPAKHLNSLDLSENRISHLPQDMFTEMPSLKEIVLEGNSIQTLPATTWSPIWQQLSRLYLSENPLNCDSNISWISDVSRPHVLKGVCSSPPERKGLELKHLVDRE